MLRDRGDLDGAARELRAAITALDWPIRSLILAERRSAYRSDKWETYAQLALIEHARGLESAAFEVNEQQRSREMHELLAGGRVGNPQMAADLTEREQDLRRRIIELARQVSAPARIEAVRGPDLSLANGAAPNALLRAQDEYADLMLRIRERAPRHAEVVAPRVARWRDVAQRLAPDQAFITYLLSDSTSLAFVVTQDTLVTLDLGVGRRELSGSSNSPAERWSSAPQIPSGGARFDGSKRISSLPCRSRGCFGEVRARDRAACRAALSAVWGAALRRTPPPVPGGSLHDHPRRLRPRYGWSWKPDRPALRGRNACAGPRPDALPASRREVAAVERLAGGDARVRLGRMASEDVFKREAGGHPESSISLPTACRTNTIRSFRTSS